jgi:hypothetical protein
MNTTKRALAVGVFTDHAQANRAVDELKRRGFRNDQIGVAGRDWRSQGASKSDTDTMVGEGALAGALTGAGLGGLVGLGVLSGMIPVIGPAIAAGTLGVLLTNAAGGAVIASIVGALVGAGVSEEDASYYEGEIKSGRYLVTVRTDGRFDEVKDVFQRYGACERSASPSQVCSRQETMHAAASNQRVEMEEDAFDTEKHHV